MSFSFYYLGYWSIVTSCDPTSSWSCMGSIVIMRITQWKRWCVCFLYIYRTGLANVTSSGSEEKKNNFRLLDVYHVPLFLYTKLLPILHSFWIFFLCVFFLLWNTSCRWCKNLPANLNSAKLGRSKCPFLKQQNSSFRFPEITRGND